MTAHFNILLLVSAALVPFAQSTPIQPFETKDIQSSREPSELSSKWIIRTPGLATSRLVAFRENAVPFAERGTDKVSKATLPLISQLGTSPSQQFVRMLLPHDEERVGNAAIGNILNSVYITEVKFGNELFRAVLDTGSADTWLVEDGFKCVNSEKIEIPPAKCQFGKSYTRSKSLILVPDRHFNTSYADGEFLSGSIGRETVNLGSITVHNQTVGLVDYASWMGDGLTSGLIGLAFPHATRAFPVSANPGEKKGPCILYNPIFTTMHKQGLTAPYFSIALNRPEEGSGILALGGLPGPPVHYSTEFARAPMEYLALRGEAAAISNITRQYQLYMVSVEGFSINSQDVTAKTQVVIDSGTTLSYLPVDIAKQINDAWSPPASLHPVLRQYIVDCNATAPRFAVIIGGKKLWIDAKDMALSAGLEESSTLCISAVQESKDPMAILGGPFLKSVVAVFDVGAAEMRFANRIR